MTTIVKWLNNRYVIGWSMLFWAAVDLVLVGIQCDLSKSDWGTWVGSIGTVATFIGTIFLATSESRRRRHAEIQIADLRAAELIAGLVFTLHKLRAAQRLLTAAATQHRGDPHVLEMAYRFIAEIPTWNFEDALPFTAYPSDIAKKLVLAFTGLRSTKEIAEIYCRNQSTVEDRMRQADDFLEPIARTMISVEYVQQVLSEHAQFDFDRPWPNPRE